MVWVNVTTTWLVMMSQGIKIIMVVHYWNKQGVIRRARVLFIKVSTNELRLHVPDLVCLLKLFHYLWAIMVFSKDELLLGNWLENNNKGWMPRAAGYPRISGCVQQEKSIDVYSTIKNAILSVKSKGPFCQVSADWTIHNTAQHALDVKCQLTELFTTQHSMHWM